jgi:hypothetical protein
MIYDIIIPTTDKDLKTLEECIQQCKKHLNHRRIIVVSKQKYTESAEWFSEDRYPFNFKNMETYIGDHWRKGWYLQQLLKLYSFFIIPNIADNILILDSDTLILRKIEFFEEDKPLYNTSRAHHKPYFRHMEQLLPELKRITKSGITHHMIFQRNIMLDLFNKVEEYHDEEFWKVFLSLVDLEQKSGASEYEIYFNFIQIYHQNKFKIRNLKWENTKNKNLNQELDYISCHSYL